MVTNLISSELIYRIQVRCAQAMEVLEKSIQAAEKRDEEWRLLMEKLKRPLTSPQRVKPPTTTAASSPPPPAMKIPAIIVSAAAEEKDQAATTMPPPAKDKAMKPANSDIITAEQPITANHHHRSNSGKHVARGTYSYCPAADRCG
ncbi:unnamed protein product [Linum trigynum]|uniref:FRIGIDA-like protein n=1 Tax=Linum trigynum TaxID=586398 RepID=A0AAV2FY67_9ROSI